ncbi:hypothetical protein J2X83_002426 [Brevibacillus nitrificans]|nr:hypothetical protein [Brevibacillus nitrificans]
MRSPVVWSTIVLNSDKFTWYLYSSAGFLIRQPSFLVHPTGIFIDFPPCVG